MKAVSLKIDDDIFMEVENIVSKVNMSRNKYINEAIDSYNKIQQRELLKKQLRKESKLVGEDSLRVLHEFEAAENGN